MTRRFILRSSAALALALALVSPGASASPAASTARADVLEGLPSPDHPDFFELLMKRVDDMYRGDRSHAKLTMQVKTKHYARSMSLESWSLGTEHSLIRILSPKKEKGTATLKSGDELFTFLSKTGRTIKITGAMMGGRWMGSHFTNDDLVRDSRYSEDFVVRKTYEGAALGTEVYRFTLTPKPNATVVWGKVDVIVRKGDLMPLQQLYYDEDGAKVRAMEYGDFKELGGRTLPTRITMRPLDGSGEYTQITYDLMEFGVKLDASFFSLQQLKAL